MAGEVPLPQQGAVAPAQQQAMEQEQGNFAEQIVGALQQHDTSIQELARGLQMVAEKLAVTQKGLLDLVEALDGDMQESDRIDWIDAHPEFGDEMTAGYVYDTAGDESPERQQEVFAQLMEGAKKILSMGGTPEEAEQVVAQTAEKMGEDPAVAGEVVAQAEGETPKEEVEVEVDKPAGKGKGKEGVVDFASFA